MLSFKDFIREYAFDAPAPKREGKQKKGITQTRVLGGAANKRGQVYRADVKGEAIPHRTYLHNKDWSQSGGRSATEKVEPGMSKDKGTFAVNRPKDVAPYTGVARDEPRVWNDKTLRTRKGGKTNVPATLTAMKGDSFKRLPSGEMLSRTKPRVTGRTTLQNPVSFRKAYRKEKQVKDVGAFNQRAARRNIDASTENV